MSFVSDLEQYSSRTFAFRDELTLLVDSALVSGRLGILRDAAFHAKFVTKTREVMQRIGPNGDGYDKLAAEFKSSIETASARLREVLADAPEDKRSAFEQRFLRMDPMCLDELLNLLSELAWIKNWEVDGKPLPGLEAVAPEAKPAGPPDVLRGSEVNHAFRSAILGVVLILIFALHEPPVTFLGLMLAGLGVVQFIVVTRYLYRLRRHLTESKG